MPKKQITVSLRKPPSPESIDAFVHGSALSEATVDLPEERAEEPMSSVRLKQAAADDYGAPTVDSVPMVVTVPSVVPAEEMTEAHFEDTTRSDQDAPALPTLVTPAGATLRPVTVYLPAELADRLALYCVTNDRDASNLVAETLTGRLSPPNESEEPVAENAEPEAVSEAEPASVWSRIRSFEWTSMPRQKMAALSDAIVKFVRPRQEEVA